VLGRSNKIILDEKNGQGVVPYLPLDELMKKPLPKFSTSGATSGQEASK
jgi:hypothetical protein